MRRIQTKADIDKKKRKNQIVVGSVMIFLLFGSILGYSLMSGNKNEDSNSEINENGVDFFKQNGLWVTEIDSNVFGFQNLPSEVADIDVNISVDFMQYSGKPLYLVNPGEGVPGILNNIGKYALRYQEACLDNVTCEGDLPIKNCDSNLIIFENSNSSKVYQNDSCVFIVGDSLRATDAFLYKVLQII